MALPDISDLNSVGGVKQNEEPVENPNYQLDATHWNTVAADNTAMGHTAIRAYAKVQLNGASAPTLLDHDAIWGDLPGVAPTVARDGAGVYSIDWPTTINDQLGVSHSVSFRDGWVGVRNNTIKLHPYIDVELTPNQTTLRLFTSADAASDGTSGQIVSIYMI